jgi:hypothetical protein
MNLIEVCEELNLGAQCASLAEKNPRVEAFWKNCNRADWMLALLVDEFRKGQTKDQNKGNLLEFIGKVRSALRAKEVSCDGVYDAGDIEASTENSDREFQWFYIHTLAVNMAACYVQSWPYRLGMRAGQAGSDFDFEHRLWFNRVYLKCCAFLKGRGRQTRNPSA